MEKAKIKEALELHALWLTTRGKEGKKAYLSGVYLRGADLRGADLRGAYLRGADLREADLRGADLREAYLAGVYLRGADLREASLASANLCGADLGEANLIDGGQDSRGYRLVGVPMKKGLYIAAGCRWFSVSEARRHWGLGSKSENADECLARVEFIVSEAARRGWNKEDKNR